MKPGRELDALVAEKVMGWKMDASAVWHGPGPSCLVLPHYSTDIADAWEIVEKLQSQDWACILDNVKDFLGNWQAHFEKDRRACTAESESAPHAIALAALKAVGV